MGILDRRSNLREQAVHRSCQLRHVLPDRRRRRRNQVPVLYREQAFAERRQGPSTFAVGTLGGDVADKEGGGAGNQRGQDLMVELRQVEERGEREQKGGEAG